MELIDVLDENGIMTGKVATRKEVHKNGLWHRSIIVAIVNKDNQLLIQQRSFDKEKILECGIFPLLDIFLQAKILYPLLQEK